MIKTFYADNGCDGRITLKDNGEGLYIPPLASATRYDIEMDENDVVICSHPKSGLHWIWEVTYMMIKRQTEPTKLLMIDYMLGARVLRKIEKLPGPKVLAGHDRFDDLPLSVKQKKCKIINIIRDPRAAAVSGFNFFSKLKSMEWKGDWNGYLNLFLRGKVLYGDWFSFSKSWEAAREFHPEHPILVLHYEDVVKNPFKEFQRLARFLQSDLTDNQIRKIADETSFSRFKASKDEDFKPRTVSRFFEGGSYPIFRKGSIDDWKNYFTLQQNAEFEEMYKERMDGYKLKLKSMLSVGSHETGCIEVKHTESKL